MTRHWAYGICLTGYLLGAPVRAATYVYVDPQGVTHFTNEPVAGAKEYHPGDDLGFGGGEASERLANTPRMWTAPTVQDARSGKYDAVLQRAARRYRLPAALLKAVTAAESGFNPQAKSHAGACGLMQLMPATAAQMQVDDIFDPASNIMGGARYLRYLLNALDGDVKLAVAAYNAGPTLVARLRRVPHIPETQVYVKRVLRLYKNYRRLELLAAR